MTERPGRARAPLGESLALAPRVGHVSATGTYLVQLGVVAVHEGDDDRAASLLEEALTLARQSEEELLIAQCLWGLAVVAAAQSRPVRAVRLWGAAESLRYTWPSPRLWSGRLRTACFGPCATRSGRMTIGRSKPGVRRCVERTPSLTPSIINSHCRFRANSTRLEHCRRYGCLAESHARPWRSAQPTWPCPQGVDGGSSFGAVVCVELSECGGLA